MIISNNIRINSVSCTHNSKPTFAYSCIISIGSVTFSIFPSFISKFKIGSNSNYNTNDINYSVYHSFNLCSHSLSSLSSFSLKHFNWINKLSLFQNSSWNEEVSSMIPESLPYRTSHPWCNTSICLYSRHIETSHLLPVVSLLFFLDYFKIQ